jgi:hypothetical protein
LFTVTVTWSLFQTAFEKSGPGVGVAVILGLGDGRTVGVTVGVAVVVLFAELLPPGAMEAMGALARIARTAMHNSATVNVLLEPDISITPILVE